MTVPRKTAARKAPAKKATPASVAARREVRSEKGKPVVFTVAFRGDKFDVPLDKVGNGRIYLRQKALEQFAGPDEICSLLFDILGQRDSARFINLMGDGDNVFEAAGEFFRALNKASNVPNS